MLEAVIAVSDNGAFGYRGGLPWRDPSDLKRFRLITSSAPPNTENVLIMGWKTFQSVPKGFPGRKVVVIKRGEELPQFSSVGRTFVIGGAGLLNSVYPKIDRWLISRIPGEYPADVWFNPEWLSGFQLVETIDGLETWERI